MRQELIDFAVWIASGHDGIYPGEEAELVDEYLKSINSAQVETPSVGENEQARKICPSCESGDCTIIRIPMNRCNECGVEWQIG